MFAWEVEGEAAVVVGLAVDCDLVQLLLGDTETFATEVVPLVGEWAKVVVGLAVLKDWFLVQDVLLVPVVTILAIEVVGTIG